MTQPFSLVAPTWPGIIGYPGGDFTYPSVTPDKALVERDGDFIRDRENNYIVSRV